MSSGKVGASNPGPIVQSFDSGKRIELVVAGKLTREGVSALLEEARSRPEYTSARNKFEFRMKQRGDQSVLQLKRRGKWESFKGTLSAVFSFSTTRNAQSNRRVSERQQAATQLFDLLEKPLVPLASQKSSQEQWQQSASTRAGAQAIARTVDAGLQPLVEDPDKRGTYIEGPEVGRYAPPSFESLMGSDNSFVDPDDQHRSQEAIDSNELNRDSAKAKPGQKIGEDEIRRGSLFGSQQENDMGLFDEPRGSTSLSNMGLFAQNFVGDDQD
jgi:hypothetical protein